MLALLCISLTLRTVGQQCREASVAARMCSNICKRLFLTCTILAPTYVYLNREERYFGRRAGIGTKLHPSPELAELEATTAEPPMSTS